MHGADGVNVFVVCHQIYDDIPADLRTLVEDVVLNRNPEATEKLLARAEYERTRKDTDVVRFWEY